MATNAASSQPGADLITSIQQSCLVLVIDSAGVVREANARLLERLGRKEQSVVGASLAELLAEPGSKEGSFAALIADIFNARIRSALLHFRVDGGATVVGAASLHLQGEGQTLTATIIATELNPDSLAAPEPRRRSEEAIHQRLVVLDYDPDGAITGANPHALSLLDYKITELRGKNEEVLLTTPVFEGEKCQERWRNLRAGKAVDHLCHFFSQGGDDVFVQAHYQPVLDAEGAVQSILMLGCDVSPTEKRLRKAFAMMEKKSAALNVALQEAREAHQMREEMDRALQAMATPVTPIWDEVLLLPLVGVVDSTRTDDAMKTTLDKISATGAKMFILDISGVPSVDTAVANQLIKITKATKIMGCETIVSGVSSAIAHTIVELGIDIGEMLTTSSLRDAVSISLDRVNDRKKEKKKNKKISKQPKRPR